MVSEYLINKHELGANFNLMPEWTSKLMQTYFLLAIIIAVTIKKMTNVKLFLADCYNLHISRQYGKIDGY